MGEDFQPRLYLIMRSDIPGMNPGKLAAQAAHVASVFENAVLSSKDLVFLRKVADWRAQSGVCGKTIVLIGNEEEIVTLINDNHEYDGADLYYDPTYPWKNYYGETFLTNEITGSFFFAYTQEHAEKVAHLSLHP